MKMEIEVPSNFQGPVTGNLTSRRGMVVASEVLGNISIIEAEIPLSETFGYSDRVAAAPTQGQGTFTMEFAKHSRVPGSIQAEIVAERLKKRTRPIGQREVILRLSICW